MENESGFVKQVKLCGAEIPEVREKISDLLTAQIGLNAITSNDNTTTGQTLAVITMVTIPVIIIYSLFSKQIVEGVISTGSKEG